MRVTRRELSELISQSLKEAHYSQGSKREFGKQIRDRHPELYDAYFIHWIHLKDGRNSIFNNEDGEFSKVKFAYALEHRINDINSNRRELSTILVDPSGKNLEPFESGHWGLCGIIMQGIPTFGGGGDLMSDMEMTPSGNRYYPGKHPADEEEDSEWGERYDPEEYLGKEVGERVGEKGLFSNPAGIRGLAYSYEEWIVVPDRVVGIVVKESVTNEYEDSTGSVTRVNRPDAAAVQIVRGIAAKHGIPFAYGDEEMSALYKRAYAEKL
tara:strand:- start:15182 stop:15985 length:804 start_codon:yes stop_codon:yes gene_type:complete